MVRGWILFSTLVLSVLFRLYPAPDKSDITSIPTTGFLFSDRIMDTHSYVYFLMEKVIALSVGLCMVNPKWLRDDTPNKIMYLYYAILIVDLFHFIGWMRDEGPGFNIAKVVVFSVPLLWIQLKQLSHP